MKPASPAARSCPVSLALLLLLVAPLPLSAAPDDDQARGERPVEAKLDQLRDSSADRLPPELLEAGRKGLEELKKKRIVDHALNVGDRAPEFTLGDARGRKVSSGELLAKGPMVLVFYRGSWCPFCNLYLRSLQEYVPEFEARGASLVAVSGESPDNTLTVEQKNALTFTVLSDPGFETARRFSIVYEMPEVVNEAVLARGFDMAKYYGTGKAELPLSVTYVIDQGGTIRYAFIDPDYKRRAEPADVLAVLDSLK